jgi:hypothetical protein
MPRHSPRSIAPLSMLPSTRLRLLVGYFAVSGGVAVLTGVAAAIAALVGAPGIELERRAQLLSPLILALFGVAWLAISRLLHRRRGAARWWALTALLLPVTSWVQGTVVTLGSMLLMLMGLALLASVWGELRESDEREE